MLQRSTLGLCCLMHLVRLRGGNELMTFLVDPNTLQLANAVEACEILQMELVSWVPGKNGS